MSLRRWQWPVAGTAAVMVAVAVTVVVQARSDSEADAGPRLPFVKGTQSVATYSYADAVRESVLVNTRFDSDADGRPDQVSVDLIRPREAAKAGTKVPVILNASPYNGKSYGSKADVKRYDAAGTVTRLPEFVDNYFVPRGYAVAMLDLLGTGRSTGCMDSGGPEEIGGAVAVIDWLNGRAKATYRDGKPAVADWSTGKIGMIGKSWDGSTANGVAATGVEGLETIVPIAAISNNYDQDVRGGILAQDTDPTYWEGDLNSRPKGVCDRTRAAHRAAAGTSGDYGPHWAQRNHLPNAGRVRASVFAVHGQADVNVLPSQTLLWWAALGKAKVPRKLWLSQAAHSHPFNYRRTPWVQALHRWFDHWLHDLPNGVMDEPPVSIERGSGQWAEEKSWPAADARSDQLPLGGGSGTTGTIGNAGTPTALTFTDDPAPTEAQAVTNPTDSKLGRLVFLSGELPAEVRLSGVPSVTLRVRVNQPTTELTARLVDYGVATRPEISKGLTKLSTQSCIGERTAADNPCAPDFTQRAASKDLGILTRGTLDAAHHTSLSRATPLSTDQWYSVTVPLQALDQVVPAGHVLGLIVTSSDSEYQTPATAGATIDVDPAGSRLTLPVAGRGSLPRDVAAPPAVTGQDSPGEPAIAG